MNDSWPDLTEVADLYSQSLQAHGASPLGVGWRTQESQEFRFARLLSIVDSDVLAEGSPFTVNDVGCGYGALWDYIQERGLNVSRYFGYDISDEMLTECRRRVPPASAEIICSDRATQQADYSIASGIFNVRFEVVDDDWARYMRSAVRLLAESSRRGFAFNAMTTYSDYQEPHLYYADPLEWFDWCKREITPRVALFHDYALYEWTITGATP